MPPTTPQRASSACPVAPKGATRHRRTAAALLLALTAVVAARGWAQVVTVPARIVATGEPFTHATIQSSDVATGVDGTVLVVWNEVHDVGGKAPYALATGRLSDDAVVLAPPVRTESRHGIYDLRVSPSPSGYYAVWREGNSQYVQHDVRGRRLDLAGIGATADFDVDASDHNDVGRASTVIGRPTGAVFVWQDLGDFLPIWSQFFDPAGERVGITRLIENAFGAPLADLDGTATPDGGYLIAYMDRAIVFDAAGNQVDLPFPVIDGDTYRMRRVAVSPRGDVIAVVGVKPFGTYDTTGSEIWLHRLTIDGMPLGAEQLVYADPPYALEPDLEFDLNGNLLVVWTEGGKPYARGYDADGNPLGPAVPIATAAYGTSIRTTRLASGDFLNVWNAAGAGAIWGNVVSLCAPGTSVCGDGAVDPLCEQCDAGAANSDSTPDACRTSCRLARCGDGVVDSGETCDDGNRFDCDGCSALCTLEVGLGCGDGVAYPSCGEECDDANAIDGDGCSSQCVLERIPGGGHPASDCYTEWMVINPGNDPVYDIHGVRNVVQRCTDGDPRCDFDGAVSGSCTFHVRVCANNTDLPACKAPSRLATWQLTTPSAKQAAKNPSLDAVRSALLGTVPASIVGPGVRDLCTDTVALVVPLRANGEVFKPATRKLKSDATLYSGVRDVDKLRLVCMPAAG